MCLVNRLKGAAGECESTAQAVVAAAHPHFGEEKPLVGHGGSGTIFFGRCSLLCEYCQNFEISHGGAGAYVSDKALGDIMIGLQEKGCHNINLVTPTHFAPNIVQAVWYAVARGLRIPLVYNTSSYDSVELLRLLDGIVDIYLADYKYADEDAASDYSAGAADYPQVAEAAILEMHRQVGSLVVDEHGIAQRGLMLRHLVLPNNAAGTDKFVRFVAEKLGAYTYVNIMGQYRPAYNAHQFPELARPITPEEHLRAVEWALAAGLRRVET